MGVITCLALTNNGSIEKDNISIIYKSRKDSSPPSSTKEFETLSRTGLTDTILIIASGFAVLLISVLLIAIGIGYPVTIILSIITPLAAFGIGVVGLRIYAEKSEARNDRLNVLTLWLSMGLIMFSLAEITGTLAKLTQTTQQMILTMIMIQIPGILLWGLGIVQYLSSLNAAMKISDSGRLWSVLIGLEGVSSIGLILVMAFLFPDTYLIERIILSPIIIGLLLFSVISLGLVWIFRDGLLSRPLLFIFMSFSLLAIRTILWATSEFQVNTPLDSLMAIEVYVFCGAALLLSRDLDELYG